MPTAIVRKRSHAVAAVDFSELPSELLRVVMHSADPIALVAVRQTSWTFWRLYPDACIALLTRWRTAIFVRGYSSHQQVLLLARAHALATRASPETVVQEIAERGRCRAISRQHVHGNLLAALCLADVHGSSDSIGLAASAAAWKRLLACGTPRAKWIAHAHCTDRPTLLSWANSLDAFSDAMRDSAAKDGLLVALSRALAHSLPNVATDPALVWNVACGRLMESFVNASLAVMEANGRIGGQWEANAAARWGQILENVADAGIFKALAICLQSSDDLAPAAMLILRLISIHPHPSPRCRDAAIQARIHACMARRLPRALGSEDCAKICRVLAWMVSGEGASASGCAQDVLDLDTVPTLQSALEKPEGSAERGRAANLLLSLAALCPDRLERAALPAWLRLKLRVQTTEHCYPITVWAKRSHLSDDQPLPTHRLLVSALKTRVQRVTGVHAAYQLHLRGRALKDEQTLAVSNIGDDAVVQLVRV